MSIQELTPFQGSWYESANTFSRLINRVSISRLDLIHEMLFKYKAKLSSIRPSFHLARWSTDSWTWEIISCALSIVNTVAVASVLFMFDDKSLPKLPYNIGVSVFLCKFFLRMKAPG